MVKGQQMTDLILSAQKLATGQAEWLEDNGMVVSPGKSKFVICANQELRRERLQCPPQGIVVGGHTVMPTPSERILGLYIDQDITWRSYLWGEEWRDTDNFPGLIPQLMGRVAMLGKLATLLPRAIMPSLVAGLFMSKLTYGLQVFSYTWGLPTYRVTAYKATSISKEEINTLQILQKALRSITGGQVRDCSTKELLEVTGYLSVHQLGALMTMTSFHAAQKTGFPKWVTDKIVPLADTRTRKSQIQETPVRLNCRGESYLPRAIKLYNQLPPDMKMLPKKEFRSVARSWVWENIPIKP